VGPDVVFLEDPFFGPLHTDVAFLGEGLHPAVIIVGPLTQDLLADGVDLVEVTEEVDDVLGAGEQGQMTEDDDTVETVVYQGQQAAKQLCEGFHRSPPVVLASVTRSSARRPVEIKVPTAGGEREESVPGKETAGCVPLLSSESAPPRRSGTGRNLLGFQNFKYLWVDLECSALVGMKLNVAWATVIPKSREGQPLQRIADNCKKWFDASSFD
jgi:hypothetical protein